MITIDLFFGLKVIFTGTRRLYICRRIKAYSIGQCDLSNCVSASHFTYVTIFTPTVAQPILPVPLVIIAVEKLFLCIFYKSHANITN